MSDSESRLYGWLSNNTRFQNLLEANRKYFDITFTLLLSAFIGTLLVLTLQYGSATQLAPLIIGIPTFVMLIGLLIMQLSPRVAGRVNELTSADVLDMDSVVRSIGQETEGEEAVEEPLINKRWRILGIIAWVGLLLVMVLLLGFVTGSLLFLLVFYRWRAEVSWPRAIGYSVAIWAFIILIFRVALNTVFYPGLLGLRLLGFL